MATLLDLLVGHFDGPGDAAAMLPEAEAIRRALSAAPADDSWQVFWRTVAEFYDNEDELALTLGINDDFTDTGFVG